MPSTANRNLNVTALCREGWLKEALYILLTTHNSPVNSSTYLQPLQTCIAKKTLPEAKKIYSYINERVFKFGTHKLLQNTLIRMYDKCGCLVDGRQVFDQMTERDVFSWNSIIAAYRRHGYPQEALTLFHQMQPTGVQPNEFTFASILPACAKIRALEQGMDIHQSIIESGFMSDVVVVSALVDMYVKCGSVHKARELFDKMAQRDVVSWTAMIAGYAQNGVLDEASRLFLEMPQRNVVSWNAMITGYAQNGFVEKALGTFNQMQLAGIEPVSITFASILPACAKMGDLERGLNIHQSIMERGFSSDAVVANALVDMYAKCGSPDKARQVFDKMPQKDVVSWTAMIAGYSQNGILDEALRLFEEMPQRNVVSWNAMIAGYAQNGALDNALRLFEEMPQRNVVSWTAMIAGYAQNGFVEKALETFKQMQLTGVKPDCPTFVSILPACAKMGALEQGIDIHQSIMERGFLSDVVVANALVDMYAKCGSILKAREMFDKMPQKNVVSWTAMIAGYAQNGLCKDALQLFELMKHSKTYPDHVSFTSVLLACSHAGLVDEGCKYFNDISDSCHITPTIDHYVLMVDLLGRAGYLEETLNFIIKMPIKPAVIVWTCLLGACRAHKSTGLGVFTATLLFEMDPKNAATYVLLSNIYAEVGRWGEVQMVRKLMKDRGIKKIPGCSWIESHKMVHAFCVGDTSYRPTQET